MLGNDFYEDRGEAEAKGIPPLGIGPGTIVKNAIIDKNARIGKNCVIRADGKKGDYDGDCYFVRDGIVIIPKGGIVPDGSTI